jgi:hypothetical protein
MIEERGVTMDKLFPLKFGEVQIPASPFQTASYRALTVPILPEGSSIQTYRMDSDGRPLDLPSVTINSPKVKFDQVGNVMIIP